MMQQTIFVNISNRVSKYCAITMSFVVLMFLSFNSFAQGIDLTDRLTVAINADLNNDGLNDLYVHNSDVIRHIYTGGMNISVAHRVLPQKGKVYLATGNPNQPFNLKIERDAKVLNEWLARTSNADQLMADVTHKLRSDLNHHSLMSVTVRPNGNVYAVSLEQAITLRQRNNIHGQPMSNQPGFPDGFGAPTQQDIDDIIVGATTPGTTTIGSPIAAVQLIGALCDCIADVSGRINNMADFLGWNEEPNSFNSRSDDQKQLADDAIELLGDMPDVDVAGMSPEDAKDYVETIGQMMGETVDLAGSDPGDVTPQDVVDNATAKAEMAKGIDLDEPDDDNDSFGSNEIGRSTDMGTSGSQGFQQGATASETADVNTTDSSNSTAANSGVQGGNDQTGSSEGGHQNETSHENNQGGPTSGGCEGCDTNAGSSPDSDGYPDGFSASGE